MEELKLSDNLEIDIAKAFKIISSIELYPEFIPGYKKVQLLEKTSDYIKVDITPSIPVKNIIMEAFLKFPNEISFKQLSGPLDIFEGMWVLKYGRNDNITEVDFKLKYYVRNFIIRKIVYKFIQMSFNDIITSFKIRGKKIN